MVKTLFSEGVKNMNTEEIRNILKELVDVVKGVVQLRYHSRKTRQILCQNGKIRNVESGRISGVGVRVWVDGIWGFSSTTDISKDSIYRTIKEAFNSAKMGKGLKEKTVEKLTTRPKKGVLKVKETRPLEKIPLEEKIEMVRKLDESPRKISNKVISTLARYMEMVDEKVIVTSYGTDVIYKDSKADVVVYVVASSNGEMESGFPSIGATGGWGELFRRFKPEDMVEEAVKIAVNKLGAKYPEGGTHTVVLHPSLVGILAHEAIGHTVEADFVLSGSIVKGKIGEKVASEMITLVDSPNPQIEKGASGILLVDDEGVDPMEVKIIENGVLKSYLHDSESSTIFGVENTGNARAFLYSDEPIIRMRNTYILPGETDPEEIIASTKEGYYLKRLGGAGQADANAEFMFGVMEAWKIENGKLVYPVKEVTISGQAFDVLSSVDMVGNDFMFALGVGYCGKHQPAKVDAGGPHIRCKVKIGGRK